MIRWFATRLRRFRRSEDGGPTIEFVILFPAFILIFLGSFESGLMMVRNVMLERSVDLAVRSLRLGTPVPPTYEEFKESICDEALIFKDCMKLVQIQLEPVDMTTWNVPANDANCIDEATHNAAVDPINPIDDTTFIGGGNNELMIVRVCALFNPMFPGTTLGMQMPVYQPDDPNESQKYALVVTSAFVNEPSRSEDES
jgi:hypothetical protein